MFNALQNNLHHFLNQKQYFCVQHQREDKSKAQTIEDCIVVATWYQLHLSLWFRILYSFQHHSYWRRGSILN